MGEAIFTSINQLLVHYGLFGIFALLTLENFGFPLPTELGYLAALSILIEDRHATLPVFLVLTSSHVCGSVAAYLVAHQARPWVMRRYGRSPEFQQMERRLGSLYQKHGALTVFSTRFIGQIRPWSSFIAGLANYPFPLFLWLTILSSILFNLIALFLTKRIAFIWRHYPGLRLGIAGLMILSFLAIFVYYFYQQRQQRHHPKK